ncbi:MAG: protein kinase, partial [Chloroflexia bacterium]
MLIKRLGAVQSQNEQAATPEEPMPPKGVLNTEVMPPTAGTAPLPRSTVLQGRYDIEHVLGIGGMSTVYKARDLRFSTVTRYCAIKEMPDTSPDPRTGQLRLANFEREAS